MTWFFLSLLVAISRADEAAPAPTAPPCPDLAAETERSTLALIAGDFTTSDDALRGAESSLACAPASSDMLSRWMLARGAHLSLTGGAPSPWLAASRRLNPAFFDDRLGPAVRASWEVAAPEGRASLTIEPAVAGRLDGATTTAWPVEVDAGPHVVQVYSPEGAVLFGRTFEVDPDENALIPTRLAPDAPIGDPEAVRMPDAPKKRTRKPGLLVSALALAAAGGGLAAGAIAQTATMEAAPDLERLEAANGAQRGMAIGAYSAWGAAAVTGALFVFVR
jgi:hypothetical protein